VLRRAGEKGFWRWGDIGAKTLWKMSSAVWLF